MSESQQLRQSSIPSAREVLRNNYRNLLQVADYCESNYGEAQDKRRALEETMTFATQSLASVAYQISNLASDILKMLDFQAAEVRKVEANVSCITQVVDMHKEKVARREIGTLAVCKTFPHYQKIISPARLEPLEAYYRKPLNFSSLDDVGHGVKVHLCGRELSNLVLVELEWKELPFMQVQRAMAETQQQTSQSAPAGEATGLWSQYSHPSSLMANSHQLHRRHLSEADDLLPPPQADVLPPPPATMDDMPPPDFPEPDLDFPASPPPPPLDSTDLGCLGPPLLPPPPPPEKLPWAPETYLEKVVTLYPYTRQKENELSFAEGAVIYVTRKYSDGWCEGVTSDAEGLFPENYVELFY
ncbi:hypothetical protein lerEdw1_001499 [Lerista edwardsae]|nr:hypothetical protein lerEdw1_001499 [Lerista edwardsae]